MKQERSEKKVKAENNSTENLAIIINHKPKHTMLLQLEVQNQYIYQM